MALEHPAVGEAPVLDDAPIAVLLAVFPADRRAKKHDGPRSWTDLRSSKQRGLHYSHFSPICCAAGFTKQIVTNGEVAPKPENEGESAKVGLAPGERQAWECLRAQPNACAVPIEGGGQRPNDVGRVWFVGRWGVRLPTSLTGTFGMMSGRSLAPRARHESGPDATADGGTSAASHCMNSSGDITIWVVPSRIVGDAHPTGLAAHHAVALASAWHTGDSCSTFHRIDEAIRLSNRRLHLPNEHRDVRLIEARLPLSEAIAWALSLCLRNNTWS